MGICDQQHHGDGAAEQGHQGALRGGCQGHGTAEVGVHHAAQHQTQRHGCHAEAAAAQQEAQHAEEEHHTHVKHTLVAGISANDAQNGDDGQQDLLGHIDDAADAGCHQQAQQQQEHAGDQAAGQNGIEAVGAGLQEGGAGLQAVNIEHGHDDRGHGITGDSKGQHGDESTADAGVVGAFGGHDALHRAFTEGAAGLLDNALGLTVSQEGCHRAAGTGQSAHEGTDHAVPHGTPELLHHLLDADHLLLNAGDLAVHGAFRYDRQNLGKAEQTHQRGNGCDTGLQVLDAEGQTGGTQHGVNADLGQEDAQQGADEALGETLGGQAAHGSQAEQGQQEVIHGLELQSNAGDGLGQQAQRHQAEHAAHEGIEGGVFQRLIGFAPLGHGIAVQSGDHAGGSAGNVDENGGQSAGEHAHNVHAHDGGQGIVGIPGVSDGHQQRGGHGDGQAGDGTYEQACHGADKAEYDEANINKIRKNTGQNIHFNTSLLTAAGR